MMKELEKRFAVRRKYSSLLNMKILYILAAVAIILFIIAVVRMNSGRANKRKVKYIPYDENRKR